MYMLEHKSKRVHGALNLFVPEMQKSSTWSRQQRQRSSTWMENGVEEDLECSNRGSRGRDGGGRWSGGGGRRSDGRSSCGGRCVCSRAGDLEIAAAVKCFGDRKAKP
jgi:hypothetical protein